MLLCICSIVRAQEQAADLVLADLERAWSAAYLRHDVRAIDRILADEFVGIDGRGVISNKTDELAEAKTPEAGAAPSQFTILSETISDIRVRLYHETAVLTSHNRERIRSKSGESEIQYRRTTVWVKRDGRWRCVSFHASRVL
jgi:ketosteroid isomerase-like protein